MTAYEVTDKGAYVVVAFPEFGDARRTDEHDVELRSFVKKKPMVIDLRGCKLLDTPWLRLITSLSRDADSAGTYVGILGASDDTKRSADYLGQQKYLHEIASEDEVLK